MAVSTLENLLEQFTTLKYWKEKLWLIFVETIFDKFNTICDWKSLKSWNKYEKMLTCINPEW